MATITNPTRCTLADLEQHRFVSVEATILNVRIADNPCTVILTDSTRREVRLRVYPTTFALASECLFDGHEVIVSAYTGEDADGVFLVAHTVHSVSS